MTDNTMPDNPNPIRKNSAFTTVFLDTGTYEFTLHSVKACKCPSFEDKSILEDKIRFSFWTDTELGSKAYTFKTVYPSLGGAKGKRKTMLREFCDKMLDLTEADYEDIDKVWDALQGCVGKQYYVEVERTQWNNKFKNLVVLPKKIGSKPVAQQVEQVELPGNPIQSKTKPVTTQAPPKPIDPDDIPF